MFISEPLFLCSFGFSFFDFSDHFLLAFFRNTIEEHRHTGQEHTQRTGKNKHVPQQRFTGAADVNAIRCCRIDAGCIIGNHTDKSADRHTDFVDESLHRETNTFATLAGFPFQMIQNIRKERDYNVSDRVNVKYNLPEEAAKAVQAFAGYIANEVLGISLEADSSLG